MNLTIPYSSQKIVRILFSIILFLTFADILGQISKYFWSHERLLGFVKLFDLNLEGNIPSWYSSCALLLCAYLLANIAYLKKGFSYVSHWKSLSFILIYLSIDEFAELHERLNYIMRLLLHSSKALNVLWVIPASIFVITVLFTYLKFIGHLPNKIKLLFITAGAMYVGGAVGLELLENYLLGNSGIQTFLYQMVVTAEEFFEMFGIVIFIYALLSYIESISLDSLPSGNTQENTSSEASVEVPADQVAIRD